MRHIKACEIMTSPVLTISPGASFRDIADMMLRNGISGLPVVDDDGRLLGIVTEADLLRKEEVPRAQPPLIPWHGASLRRERNVDRHQKATGTTAADLMTVNVVTATEETSAHELAHLMLTHDVNRVPIVRDGRVVGIVTRADILKVFTRSDEALTSEIHETLVHDLWIDPARLSITCRNGVVTIAGQVDRHTDRNLLIKYAAAIDGVVGLNVDHLEYRIDDLALGKVLI